MAYGDPIDIRPYAPGIDMNYEDELRRIEELRKKKMRPGVADAFMALGSTLRSLGSGGRVPSNAPEILARGRANAQAEYERQLELQQREQALRYIQKTGNPELMAAYQAGMDPAKIIGFNFEEKMAEKKRGWDLEDARTKRGWDLADLAAAHKNKLDEISYLQKLQLENDPQLAAKKLELEANQAFFKSMFPGSDSGVTEASSGATTAPVTPPPYRDTGPIPGFAQASTGQPDIPTVSPQTEALRQFSKIYDLNDAEAMGLLQAAAADGQAGYVKERGELLQRRLRQSEIDQPVVMAPNSTLVSKKTNEPLFTAPDAPQDTPTSILEAEYLKSHPELSKTWMDMKRAGSNVQTPSEAALGEMYKSLATKTMPKLIDRGHVVATNMPQINALEKLIEAVPSGMTADAWIAQKIPGYSGVADAFKSITLNLAPQNKVEGSGSQSDVEYAGAISQFPQIVGTRQGNRAIVSMMKAKAQIEMDSAAAASQFGIDGDMQKFISTMKEINSRSILQDVPQEVKDLIAQAPKQEEAPAKSGESTPMSSAAKSVGMTQEQWDALTPDQKREIED